MAHDIRSPVAALSGYVNLIEDVDTNAKERTDLLGRIGSTAWNMDLVVSNVLDYYEAQDGTSSPRWSNWIRINCWPRSRKIAGCRRSAGG